MHSFNYGLVQNPSSHQGYGQIMLALMLVRLMLGKTTFPGEDRFPNPFVFQTQDLSATSYKYMVQRLPIAATIAVSRLLKIIFTATGNEQNRSKYVPVLIIFLICRTISQLRRNLSLEYRLAGNHRIQLMQCKIKIDRANYTIHCF